MTKQALDPLHDRVVLRVIEDVQEKTKGGLYIPEAAKQPSQQGEVLAIGPGRYEGGMFVKTTIRPGQKVLFGKFSGTEVQLDGDDILIIRESDILAVVNG